MLQIITIMISLALIVMLFIAQAFMKNMAIEAWRIEHAARWRSELFDRIGPLLENPEVPIELLRTIEQAIQVVDHEKSSFHFLKSLTEGSKLSSAEHAGIKKFFKERPDLGVEYAIILNCYVLAVSFNDNVYGPKIRERFSEFLADPNNEMAVTQTVVAIERFELPSAARLASA